jgi:hypothetical protein
VDTYSQEVWDYNISLSKELEKRGVDEIQFDYIRFPSDGPTQNAHYRFKKPHMTQMEALESFLMKARSELSVPISTDVFGFTGWYEMDYLGQNVRMMSRYVDVISPMLYPSHFPWFFFGTGEYTEKAKMIYQEGANRTYFMSELGVHFQALHPGFPDGAGIRHGQKHLLSVFGETTGRSAGEFWKWFSSLERIQ